MPDDHEIESSNARLAKQITQKLAAEGFIPEDRLSELETKLTGSGVNKDDWNLWIDISTSQKNDNEDSDA